MRIRTQLIASAALAALVTVLIVVGLVRVTRQAQAGLDEQAESQQVAREVANMLSLTSEFSVYGGDRAAAQWTTRYAQLVATVDHALQRRDPPAPQLVELRRTIDDLPPLFSKLRDIGQAPDSPLAQRRRDLLLERLLAETQEVVESRHRWAITIGDSQQRDQRRYTLMVLVAPAALLLLLISLSVFVARRVLAPLAHLKAAAAAMQDGDLTVRCANHHRDELGDAARAVDAMAQALQRQSAALRDSEHRLRMIADNLPALVAYIDSSETYRFTNAHYQQLFGKEANNYLGQTMRTVLGEAARNALEAHVAGVLRGERREFERHGMGLEPESTFMVNYIPEVNADGGVDGFYVMAMDITTRKQAELRQAASERLLVDITDNLPALVAYIDRQETYRFANRKYLEWLGVDPRSMIGRHVGEAVSPTFFETVRPQKAAALAGERVRWERQSTDAQGRDIHYLSDFIPNKDAHGAVLGFYALTIDITERRRAELAVTHSEQRLFELTNNMPALVGYFDMQERCQYANDTALRVLGLTRREVPGITLHAAQGESSYAQHLPHVRQVLAGRRTQFEGSVMLNGRQAHFRSHLIPDHSGDDGQQRGFYVMTFDITALKEAQHEQARIERQLRDITDNLPVLISYVDREERYVFLNATCKHWLGADSASLIGLTMAESMPPDMYEQRREFLHAALSGQRVEFNLDTVILGNLRSLQSVYIPDLQPDGSVAGIYTLSTDVSALKQVERQLTELAHADPLTELPNRRQFERRVVEGISRASRDGKPIAVMFLDIDAFKSINDNFGHATGDMVLKEFALRLKTAVRITDTAARLAGDEFVVLLEGLNAQGDAEQVAEKIVAAIRVPFATHGGTLAVTTSLGVAFCARPGPNTRLVACADEALYEAKAAGRNTYRLKSLEPEVTEYRGLPR